MYKTLHFYLLLLLICKIFLFLHVAHAISADGSICSEETIIELPIQPLSIPFNSSCHVQLYNYSIIAKKDSSIIQILITSSNFSDVLEEETDLSRKITVNLYDKIENKEKNYSGTIQPRKIFKNIYYSESSKIDISFVIIGNWSGHEVILTPKEIPFSICSEETVIELPIQPLSIPFNGSCDVQTYNYSITAMGDSSIIKILITSSPSDDVLEKETDLSRKITVNLLDKNGNKEKIYSWAIHPKKNFKNIYYSKSSHVDISYEIIGNWSGHKVFLTPKEIPFETYYKNSSEEVGKIIKPWSQEEERSYRPNCVYIFRISEDEGLSNVEITIEYLDIDEEEGEYLLIGPGSEPFESSPPLFISSVIGSKKYLVIDKAAYIVFVTGSTKRNRKGFQASWDFTGEQIEKPKVKEEDDIRQSVPICIFNTTAVEKEFQKKEAVNLFIDFRRRLANIASEFIKNQSKPFDDRAEIISESSVRIFGISKIIQVNESCQFLYAMVKISKETEQGTAAFKKEELEKIVDSFLQSYAQNEDQFKFNKCPSLHRTTKWAKIGYYLIIPVIFCLLLFAWTWKYNPVTEYFAMKRGKKRLSQQQETIKNYYVDESTRDAGEANENAYSTLPKLQVTNSQGRRYTLNLSNTLLSDGDQSEDEIFNKERPKRHAILEYRNELQHAFLTSQLGKINQGFELEEECSKDLETNVQELEMEQKSDHVYESVTSTAMQKDDEILDTKL